jgi:hypothetical protein
MEGWVVSSSIEGILEALGRLWWGNLIIAVLLFGMAEYYSDAL